jgi:hypothetical protein
MRCVGGEVVPVWRRLETMRKVKNQNMSSIGFINGFDVGNGSQNGAEGLS